MIQQLRDGGFSKHWSFCIFYFCPASDFRLFKSLEFKGKNHFCSSENVIFSYSCLRQDFSCMAAGVSFIIFLFLFHNALNVVSGWQMWTAGRFNPEPCCCNFCRMWFGIVLMRMWLELTHPQSITEAGWFPRLVVLAMFCTFLCNFLMISTKLFPIRLLVWNIFIH